MENAQTAHRFLNFSTGTNMKLQKAIPFFIIASALFFSCARKTQTPEAEAFSVVTTTFPCYDAARAVLGKSVSDETVSLSMLVKPGAEVHSFDPSPADIIAIQKSGLFIYIGGESDEWVEKILHASDKKYSEKQLRLIDFVETTEELSFGEKTHVHDKTGDAENPHEADEHIWTSPENELKIIDTVCDALCKVAQKNGKEDLCDGFLANATDYKQKILAVAEQTAEIVAAAQEKYIVMADRFPFRYFADYYGLSFDAAFSGCSTAVEANTATISRLIDTVRTKNLPAVFYIELGNHKIADSIAETCSVSAIELQSCQNITKKDFDAGETWISLMERNALALKKGLR